MSDGDEEGDDDGEADAGYLELHQRVEKGAREWRQT